MSYSTSLTTSKDQVRFLLGDTDDTDELLSDAEISAILTINSSDIYQSAIQCAQSLAAKYARLPDVSISSFRVSNSQLAQRFTDLIAQLETRAINMPGGLGSPSVLGTSISDMEDVDADSDRVPSRARVGMDETPGLASPTSSNGVSDDLSQ